MKKYSKKQLKNQIVTAMRNNNFKDLSAIIRMCYQDNIDFISLIDNKKNFLESFQLIHPLNILPKSEQNITKKPTLYKSENGLFKEKEPEKEPEKESEKEPEKESEKESEKEPEKESEKEPEKESEKEPEKEPEKKINSQYDMNTLSIYLYLAINILTLYKDKIQLFIEYERSFFSFVLNANYEQALLILQKIENEISYSKWSQFSRLIIYCLMNKYENENKKLFENYSTKIQMNSSRANIAIESNLFSNKLSDIIDTNSTIALDNYISRINLWKDQIGQFDTTKVISFLNEIDDGYFEKSIIAPFDENTTFKIFSKLIIENINLSIIDLFKTYASIISEIQINQNTFFQEYIFVNSNLINYTINLSSKLNLIKINYYKNDIKAFREFFSRNNELDLFTIYENFLNSNFNFVIDKCISELKKHPYSIDLIYYLVNSLSYLNRSPEFILNELNLKKQSLLYLIIVNFYNILNNINFNESKENIKQILLIWGNNAQWNMCLYYTIVTFLCKNTDKNNKSYSNAVKYSYFSHPRTFYLLNEHQQKNFLNQIKDIYPNIYGVFKSYNTNNCLKEYIKLSYRAKYIQYKNFTKDSNSLNLIEELYHLEEKVPFFYKTRFIVSYVEELIYSKKYEKALKIIINQCLFKKIPLCMFLYKNHKGEYLFEDCEHLPHLTLLCILDNPKDTIRIYYTFIKYLENIDPSCVKPSHLNDFLNEDRSIIIELLKLIFKEEYLNEFILTIQSRKELFYEQLSIIKIIKENDINYDKSNIEENKIKNNLKILSSTAYTKEQKISINIEKIKNQILLNNFDLIFNSYINSPAGGEKYEFYKYQGKDYAYTNSSYYKEEKLENIFRLVLSEIISSNIGIINSISENILHNHFEDTLKKSLIEEKIYFKIDNGNIDDNNWTFNKDIQNEIKKFSEAFNLFVDKLKEKIRITNSEDDKEMYFNFKYENIISEDKFKSFIFEESKFKYLNFNSEYFLDQVIYFLIDCIKIELLKGKNNIKNDLGNKFTDIFKILETIDNDRLKGHLGYAKDKIFTNYIDFVTSWFTLNKQDVYEDFSIPEVIYTLNTEYSEFKDISLNCSNYKKFKGQYFIYFHRVYYVLLHNILKHSNVENKSLSIVIREKEGFLIIENSNSFIKDKITKGNGTGLEFLSNNIKIINPKNTSTKHKNKDDYFIVTLKLVKEDLDNE